MCKLPDLKDYLAQKPEERDETTWQFMSDVKTTLSWHWKAGAALVGLLAFSGGTGTAVMYRVDDARDAKVSAIEEKVDTSLKVLGAWHERDDRRYVADSTWRVEMIRRLGTIERHIEK